MKLNRALNGVPSLSVLDGWWIEGWNEGVTGWAIGDHDEEIDEANSLYEHLEQVILPSSIAGPMSGGGSCGQPSRSTDRISIYSACLSNMC